MDYDKHLAYEVSELCRDLDRLYEVWPELHGATPQPWEQPDAVAFFEALLMHARNLMEFLVLGPVKHDNALTPRDFGVLNHNYEAASDRFAEALGEEVEPFYSSICTYVSHLSKARDWDPPYWPVQSLVEVLVDEVNRFITAVRATGTELPLTKVAIDGCQVEE